MIKPEEIRLGNNVWPDNDSSQEYTITVEDFIQDTFSRLHSIPLTEDSLIKLGAEELIRMSDNYVRYNLKGILLSKSPEREFFVEYVHQIPIKFLHSLQNFYFATKGQELTLK